MLQIFFILFLLLKGVLVVFWLWVFCSFLFFFLLAYYLSNTLLELVRSYLQSLAHTTLAVLMRTCACILRHKYARTGHVRLQSVFSEPYVKQITAGLAIGTASVLFQYYDEHLQRVSCFASEELVLMGTTFMLFKWPYNTE